MLEETVHRRALDQPSLVQEQDLVAEAARLGEIVRRHDDLGAGGVERLDDRLDLARRAGIEVRGRLVEEQHLGVQRPGARQREPLLLAAGEHARRPARVLSGGEQQRLALARAWALHPEVLFLDEPTASLDPTASREIERVIQAFDAAGTKIVMATHNLGQARRLGDEVLFLHQGRLVERAPVEQFFSRPASPEAAAFIKGELPWV